MHTSNSATGNCQPNAERSSCNNKAERRTPKTGLENENTATLDTGLYFNKRLHKEYAVAETKARYSNISQADREEACR